MTAVDTPTVPCATVRPTAYSIRGVILAAMIFGFAAFAAGNVVVLVAVVAVAPVAVALAWAFDVLSDRRTGPSWLALAIAMIVGGLALAMIAQWLVEVAG